MIGIFLSTGNHCLLAIRPHRASYRAVLHFGKQGAEDVIVQQNMHREFPAVSHFAGGVQAVAVVLAVTRLSMQFRNLSQS